MENTDTPQKDNVVSITTAIDAPASPAPETPKEPTEQEKANQQILQKATQDYVDLKTAVFNIANVHNVIAQATHHGTQVRNAHDANEFLVKMWKPLREQLDAHPMFKAEQAEANLQRTKAMKDAADAHAASQNGAANGQAPAVN